MASLQPSSASIHLCGHGHVLPLSGLWGFNQKMKVLGLVSFKVPSALTFWATVVLSLFCESWHAGNGGLLSRAAFPG